MKRSIALVGMAGTGKSTVGKLLAQKLGFSFVDLDEAIEARLGHDISQAFAKGGEAAFRMAETLACEELAKQPNTVIATGGGTILSHKNFDILQQNCLMFCLSASIETIAKRLEHTTDRPLLSGDLATRTKQLHALYRTRKFNLNRVSHRIRVDTLSVEEVAHQIHNLYELSHNIFEDIMWVDQQDGGRYPILITQDSLNHVGQFLKWLQVSGKIFIITNATIWNLHGNTIKTGLSSMPFEVCQIPDGEEYKTLATVESLYTQLLALGLTRSDTIVAIGGGIVGDIAGFVAATLLRGLNFVQIPTTLLSMVDSSIGGKVGVDLPLGKNLVGAFKNPLGVFIDTAFLKTLPQQELRCGIAEMIKHAIIDDPALFEMFEEDPISFNANKIHRAIMVKKRIVEEDPFELGRRAVLNLGHTFAHAIELVSRYNIKHGEAVAIGLVAAAKLSHALGLCDALTVKRIKHVLKNAGLPTNLGTLSPDDIIQAMQHDKKKSASGLRFIAINSIGDTIVKENIDSKQLLPILSSMSSGFHDTNKILQTT